MLESGAIRRLGGTVGGTEYRQIDVRVVAATHRDLKAMVRAGRFREDLYYRLSAFPVTVPPLRARKEDIPRVAEYFLARLPEGRRHLPLDPAVLACLMAYDFPGNVRELKNIVERACLLAGQNRLRPTHVRFDSYQESENPVPRPAGDAAPALLRLCAPRRLRAEDILRVLEHTNGHRRRAAQLLGISERTLYRQIQRLRGGRPAASDPQAEPPLPGTATRQPCPDTVEQ